MALWQAVSIALLALMVGFKLGYWWCEYDTKFDCPDKVEPSVKQISKRIMEGL